MTKRAQRTSARAFRPARTPVQGIRAKVGDIECTAANLSSTGAMLRSRIEIPVGREINMLLELPTPVATRVRVVRCEPIDVALPGAVWRRQDFALGVHLLDHHGELSGVSRSLAAMPIVLCARQAWLQQTHRSYINDRRLRLLLVPFTPAELVATVDRAIQELS
ncbi:MAG TPA: PilZ domain-containing protein [Vicinamibacterales bacterium]|nr:PilZ domain-containing protein [Vicinamibacterales bacterium]